MEVVAARSVRELLRPLVLLAWFKFKRERSVLGKI